LSIQSLELRQLKPSLNHLSTGLKLHRNAHVITVNQKTSLNVQKGLALAFLDWLRPYLMLPNILLRIMGGMWNHHTKLSCIKSSGY